MLPFRSSGLGSWRTTVISAQPLTVPRVSNNKVKNAKHIKFAKRTRNTKHTKHMASILFIRQCKSDRFTCTRDLHTHPLGPALWFRPFGPGPSGPALRARLFGPCPGPCPSGPALRAHTRAGRRMMNTREDDAY